MTEGGGLEVKKGADAKVGVLVTPVELLGDGVSQAVSWRVRWEGGVVQQLRVGLVEEECELQVGGAQNGGQGVGQGHGAGHRAGHRAGRRAGRGAGHGAAVEEV